MWAVLHSRVQAYGKSIKDDLRPYAIFGPSLGFLTIIITAPAPSTHSPSRRAFGDPNAVRGMGGFLSLISPHTPPAHPCAPGRRSGQGSLATLQFHNRSLPAQG